MIHALVAVQKNLKNAVESKLFIIGLRIFYVMTILNSGNNSTGGWRSYFIYGR